MSFSCTTHCILVYLLLELQKLAQGLPNVEALSALLLPTTGVVGTFVVFVAHQVW
jgi:hypothetical protein